MDGDNNPSNENQNSNTRGYGIGYSTSYVPSAQDDNPASPPTTESTNIISPSPIISEPIKKRPKAAIIAIICAAIIIISGAIFAITKLNSNQKTEPAVSISDLTDDQKKKLGIRTTETAAKEKDADSSEIEDKDNYSKEYNEYLELSDEEKAKLEVIPRKEKVPDEKIDEIKEDTDKKVVASLPDKFDLRDSIDITVGDQGSYGLCWSFATSTALETHLKLRGIDYNPSELQIDYLSSNYMYGSRDLHSGGSFHNFADIAAAIGTISENTFSNLAINQSNYFTLTKNDNPLYITKTVDFPSIYKNEGEAVNKTDAELKEFRDLVKTHIMTNGSLYVVTTAPWGLGIPRYCEKGGTGCNANHAMSIIGWDDSYPKENFAKVNANGNRVDGTPKHDGAYLVLNSWGKDWDGSDAHDGVFYISYDEHDVESQLSGIVSTSLDNTRKINSIPSKVVRDLIKEKLSFYIIERNGEEYISDYALSRTSYLDLSSRNLTDYDLKSITETFSNLSSLNITDNSISDLSPLTNLNNLYSVSFSKNNVKDISTLCSMDKITDFDLTYNQITDISCLKSKFDDYRTYLDISGNIGVTGYENFTNLDWLVANEIGLKDLSSLSKLTKLASLSVRNNHIKNLAGLTIASDTFYTLDLSGNKELTDLTFDKPISILYIDDSSLTDISILNNIEVATASASGNNFSNLSALKNDKIKSLNLSNSNIKSLSEISIPDKIETLSLNNNKITSLDGIEKFKNLSSLSIDGNQIQSLNGISKLTALITLSADDNKISDAADLISLKNLYFVSLKNNKLTSVPNFTDQANVYLTLENNPIPNATISPAIATINLTGCKVKTIDYAQTKELTNITLEGNPDWNDYGNLISKSLLAQQKLNRAYLYIYISTDYNFSKKELDDLNNISGLPNNSHYYLRLTNYAIELKKSSNGIVNLENYPNERAMLMSLLKNGTNFTGFSIDKAAAKLTLDDATTKSLSLEQYATIKDNISTSKITFNFK